MTYEAHITIKRDRPAEAIQEIVENAGWSFSSITDDIELGKGAYCYATRHFEADRIPDLVEPIRRRFNEEGLTVVRTKVESILYDNRAVTTPT